MFRYTQTHTQTHTHTHTHTVEWQTVLTHPSGAIWSGSILFAYDILSATLVYEILGHIPLLIALAKTASNMLFTISILFYYPKYPYKRIVKHFVFFRLQPSIFFCFIIKLYFVGNHLSTKNICFYRHNEAIQVSTHNIRFKKKKKKKKNRKKNIT